MNDNAVNSVAVIGMACRLPGGIDSPEQLWDALANGADLVTEVPADRWVAEDFYDPQPGVPGRSVSKWGAFLEDAIGFDSDFFGIGEREATAIDPQHRLLLETAWEAMEHAGLTRKALADTRTGVFVGLTHGDYQLLAADADAVEGPYGFTGSSFSLASGRIAYALGIHGPAMTVDTACSSGLTAVHLACRSLVDGESDLAFAGGSCVMLDPRKFVAGSAEGMLSPTGRCHAFDVAADGFVSAEGSVMVLLKPLTDALRDGDRVLAVIRGSAANQDGRTVNIATPSLAAQTTVYRAALASAGVDPSSVGMVEAHGPGTAVGDPIEYASLAAVYGTSGPCALASVKTNFGHAQSAAGGLGLMKTIVAIQHGAVPQNLHFTELPAAMAAIDTQLFVPQRLTPWPTNGHHPRRAAVSSYGLSGTNAHVIVEQPPQEHSADDVAPPAEHPTPALFPVSSSSAEQLRRTATRLADWIERHHDVALDDLAYTLARRRDHRPVRTAVVAGDRDGLVTALRDVGTADAPYQAAVGQDDRGPVWVFSGQGSQWAGMGAELLRAETEFAATVAMAEPLIARESGFSVTEAMTSREQVTGIDRVQPTLFTMQVALAAAMRSRGVRPGAVIGHSLGEAAAAVVAGALSLEDGVRVICRRSRLMTRIAGAGAMATVELPASQVLSELVTGGINDAVVAVVASPQSTVVGGATQTVRTLVAGWERRNVMAREIAVDVASHSPQVDPILDDLQDALAELRPMTPEVPFYSATQFDPREQPLCDAEYWALNLRQMVRFAPAVQAAVEDGHRVFAELAPHPLLVHAVEQTARGLDASVAVLAGMRREQPLPGGLLDLVAEVHAAGAAVDFSVSHPRGRLVDAPLPTWTHRRLMLTRGGQESATHGGCTLAVHPLLGAHVRLREEPVRHAWEADVGLAAAPWLTDHRIQDVAVFPGAAYCELALTAARTVFGGDSEVCDITFDHALLLDEHVAIAASATVTAPGVAHFSVETEQDGSRTRHVGATLRATSASDTPPRTPWDVTALRSAHPHRIDGTDVRAQLAEHGVQYGPAFAGLSAVHVADGDHDTVFVDVALPGAIRSHQDAYGVHPALLDACFQSVAAHPRVRALGSELLAVPLGLRLLRANGSARGARYCHTRVTTIDASGVEADLDVLDDDGVAVLEVRGLRLGTESGDRGHDERVLATRLLTIEWTPHELPDADVRITGPWLLISTTTVDAVAPLADAVKALGSRTLSMCWPQDGEHDAHAATVRQHLRAGDLAGAVIVTGRSADECGSEVPARGRDCVAQLVRIVRELSESTGDVPRVHVVTRNAQSVLPGDVANLEHAGVRGLVRAIGVEHPQLRLTQIDVDDATGDELLARQLLGESDEDESAWRAGVWYVARLSPTPLRPEDRYVADADLAQDGIRLDVRNPGDLESLELVSARRRPPGPGQVEVAVTAASINFADVLVAFGRYPAFDGRLPRLGSDFAGIVTAVGPGVDTHSVGDRVGGLSGAGCWSTFLTCDARLAVILPAALPDAQAAAVPTAHVTAYYGLQELARVTAGDKVLIHSATGGVGQAAIAIARAAGAEVFATAGTEQHRQFLRDLGVTHVYDSRSLDFADQIRCDTEGYGVDVVLNSVPGAAQRASLELLAPFGRFVEIGKRDIYGDARLGLFPFRRNLSFHAVDLALLTEAHPDRVRSLLAKVYELLGDGALPLPQVTRYPLTEAATAIRAMGGAQHTGKLVLELPHSGHSPVTVPPPERTVFRSDGAYLVTGGLGGLGLFLAERMVAAGCGRVVLCSRSQPSAQASDAVTRWRETGADVVVECGDIAQADTARHLVDAATSTGLPLRGVLHAAAVVDDATLANITDDLIDRDWAPKVNGAWRLHAASAGQPLDWFCSFSSAAALVGSPGQGAYAAANSWLDAFTHWRRAMGMPATAIGWGAWADIGRAVTVAEQMGDAIRSDEGGYAFEALLRHDRGYTGYAPIVGAPWLTMLAERSPFAQAFRTRTGDATGTSKLRAELEGLPHDEWPALLRRLISDQVGLILRRSVDPDRPLSGYGLDSLGALDLRTRIESETGVRISAPELATITIRGLAGLLCEKLAPAEAA